MKDESTELLLLVLKRVEKRPLVLMGRKHRLSPPQGLCLLLVRLQTQYTFGNTTPVAAPVALAIAGRYLQMPLVNAPTWRDVGARTYRCM